MRSVVRASVLALACLLPLAACKAPGGLGAEESPPSSDGMATTDMPPFVTEIDGADLAAQIEALTVAEEADAGYDRSLFPHWRDDDDNGCDARDDVLVAQDLSGNLTAGDCGETMSGEWMSMYDGETVTESGDLDIDHFVPLKEAWGSGAGDWTTEDRQAYANSLEQPWHLVAVTASSNRSKSDKDPADWMPTDETVWCAYIWAWTQVKTEWDLSVDEAEQAALLEYAAAC